MREMKLEKVEEIGKYTDENGVEKNEILEWFKAIEKYLHPPTGQ